jgi:hypothetical protein
VSGRPSIDIGMPPSPIAPTCKFPIERCFMLPSYPITRSVPA